MPGEWVSMSLKETAEQVLKGILPFWQGMADEAHNGFYGEADFYGKADRSADKGCILNSRILWTFSAAYRMFGNDDYKACAVRAFDLLTTAFWDMPYGGLYWLVDHTGRKPDTRKQFYNIAFGIYALSEHYRATGGQSLDMAMELFDVMEKYGLDPAAGGYIEACSREWNRVADNRLSGKDLNSPKSMNTNLHVLEAYTNLLLAGGDRQVRESLKKLLRLTLDRIVSGSRHFNLFFDMDWNALSNEISYGHDIEGSWLLYEAALTVGDESLTREVKQAALEIADGIYTAAIDLNKGGLFSGCEAAVVRLKKEWWPQAEAVVGFYNAYELSGEEKYLYAANDILAYIQKYFVDEANGDWHNELNPDNTPDTAMPKAGFWKCPYHNARMCFEIIRRAR